MKKTFLFTATCIIMILSANKANAFDLSAMNKDGKIIYYNILTSSTIEVTYGTSNYNSYSGNLAIADGVMVGNDTLWVTAIGDEAFRDCSGLTSVTIPPRVTSIGTLAFTNCPLLTSITIPRLVSNIGDGVFFNCTGLMSINVEMGNLNYTAVGGVLFDKLQDTLIQYPIGKTEINYTIPNTVTVIKNYAFYGSGLTSITIPDIITNIGANAFSASSKLTTVNFNATNCVYMGAVDLITYYPVFSNCPLLTTVNIGNNVQTIPHGAFALVNKITSITIPSGVTSIGEFAFGECTSLIQMNVKAQNPPSITGSQTFRNVPTTIRVYVPCGKETTYKNATGWKNFTNIIEENLYVVEVRTSNELMGTVLLVQAPCENNQAVIQAFPNTGYRFVRWNDGNTDNPRSVTVTSNVIFTAEFAIGSKYRVTVLTSDSVMGNVIGGGDFDLNTQTNITAIPNVGYRFVQWNDGNTESTRTITVTQDLTYTAIFEINTGIENINATAVSVYPNPATDYLTITLSGNVYQATFTLYDMQGRMLIKEEVKNEDMISVNNLASGIYVYSVNVGKESHKGKIARK